MTEPHRSKITEAARQRMAHQSANQQFAEAMRELRELREDPRDVPDADDSSATRDEVTR